MKMLNKELKIKGRLLANRLVMPPMASKTASDNGYVTDETLEHYTSRCEGGCIGMVIVEHCYISQNAIAHVKQLSVSRNEDVPGLRSLADRIHMHCGTVLQQINHAGSASTVDRMELFSASAVPNPRRGDNLPKALSVEQISALTDLFAAAAERAKKAGFDGVDVHSAHGFLLNQFLCPLTNQRNDRYGGSIENRTRFHVEVLKKIRERVGDDFIVSVRFGGCDYLGGGNSEEDAVVIAKILEDAGMDIANVSAGITGYTPTPKSGYFRKLSAELKKVLKVPVLLTGGVLRAEEADNLIVDGKADLVGVGRALLSDPAWARKAFGLNG